MAALPSPALSDLRDYALDWALVDVETSGLIARRDRVLSIAVVTIGPDGEQTGEFSTLLNPGCDPGPVHVHGLTPERLHGAPTFEQVAERIGALLRDRVLVAHNAQFDYDFLAHEFARARAYLPVSRRLCTLALNRQVDLPLHDMKLGTLAAHYGVPQSQAHDALDDTRVLAGIFRATLREAARIDLPLPIVACPPRQDSQFAPKPPKTPCAYRNPGRLQPGGPLLQGMKIAVTGETATSRPELVARSVAAGLNMVSSVSRHTSVLVTNDSASGSAKARRALAEGVPIIDETAFLDAATSERTLLLAEIYRRGPVWRLRAVGQGYDQGLGDLARRYGVNIED
nr:exonuclease domain-containing protein [Streptomyces sp. NRRL S-920]